MAYLRKVKNGWRAEIERSGIRRSKTFDTKAEATLWSGAEETEIRRVKDGGFPNKSFEDTLTRYRDEISPKKGGGPWEIKRINGLIRNFPKLVALPLVAVTTKEIAEWRDARLKEVSDGSVQRDVNVLSNVFTLARDEWKWCADTPFRGFHAPGDNPPRVRRIKPIEIKIVLRRLGYHSRKRPETKMAEVAYAFLLSLRTAMRAGEILSLSPKRIDRDKREALVPHKTQHRTKRLRSIPLNRHALRLLTLFQHGFKWTIDDASRDALFRKATRSCLIHDLTFHDARADALTRFARKVDVMTLAKISGHKDLRILLETYYRITPAEIAAMLDSPTPSPLLRPNAASFY